MMKMVMKNLMALVLGAGLAGCNPKPFSFQEENEERRQKITHSEEPYVLKKAPKNPSPNTPVLHLNSTLLPDYQTTNFSQDTDDILLARMIFGEARGCSRSEKIAVGFTAVNRAAKRRWYGKSLREVILKPSQYSCFNQNDPNRRKLQNPQQYNRKIFEECLEVSRGILASRYADPTHGATHYFNPKKVQPNWAKKMAKIGKVNNSIHEFYKED